MGRRLRWSLAVEMSALQEIRRQVDAHEASREAPFEGAQRDGRVHDDGAIELGIDVVIRIRLRAPVARAAVTNSSFLAPMTEPRVIFARWTSTRRSHKDDDDHGDGAIPEHLHEDDGCESSGIARRRRR